MEITAYIAIYAAIVATIVLVWDILKWRWSEKLSLTGRASSNMIIFEPSVPASDEEKKKYVVLTVENRGSVPCVIDGVILKHHDTLIDWLRRKPTTSAVVSHWGMDGYALPYKLESRGGHFRSKVEQTEELVAWSKNGRLYIGVTHTMSSKPFWCKVRPIT